MASIRLLIIGQVVTGYRFRYPRSKTSPKPEADGTILMQGQPISGPTYFASGVTAGYGYGYWVWCWGCLRTSKKYKIRHRNLIKWCLDHRCETRLDMPAYAKAEATP